MVADGIGPDCTASSKVLINVGANKGYSIVSFLSAWDSLPLTYQLWYQKIKEYAGTVVRADGTVGSGFLSWIACGACLECRTPRRGRSPASCQRRGAVAHALELAPENRVLLRHLVNATGLGGSVRVWDFAASNISMEVGLPPSAGNIGGEGNEISVSKKRGTVKAVTIDDFMALAQLDEVHQLAIDTEGWDALVLEGARRTLQARKIRVIEFEYSGKAYWSTRNKGERRTLRKLQRWLLAAGYSCFMLNKNALYPMSGLCWRDEFESCAWSNVVCSHDDSVLAVLHRIAEKTVLAAIQRNISFGERNPPWTPRTSRVHCRDTA